MNEFLNERSIEKYFIINVFFTILLQGLRGDPGDGGANSKGFKGDRGEFGIPGIGVSQQKFIIINRTLQTVKI